MDLSRSARRLVAMLTPGLAARRRVAHERRFYGQFVQSGALCFDVGACHGRVSSRLLELGANVVAIEANPTTAAALAARFAGDPALVVEAVALGREAGRATLHLADEATVSTLSDRFVATFTTATLRYARSVEVEVSTLDALIQRHGVPAYIKIDVEGCEPDVLAGLSTAAVLIETLSAPANNSFRTSSLARTPPPTVNGMKQCSAVRPTTS